MIQQSSANPAGIVIDPKPATTSSNDPEGQWHGFDVIRLASELVRSINPFYVPDNSPPGVAAGTDLPTLDNQTSHCPGFTTLAARAIAAWANLPPEINQALGYLANLLAAGRAASDQFDALTVAAGVVPEPDTNRENAADETVKNAKKKTGKAPQHPRHQPDKSATAMLLASQLPNTSLALGALVGLSAVGASSASDPMPIADALSLGKICRDEGFPCDGEYALAMNINGNTLNESIDQINGPFTGKLFGNNFTISGLCHCLVKHLAGEGLIENLRLTKPLILIQGSGPVGVAACKMSGNANIRNIEVEGANVLITGETVHAGIAVGMVEGGTVSNTRAKKCLVIAMDANAGKGANVGIGAGKVGGGGKVINTIADNCNVTSHHWTNANAGIEAGQSVYSTVTGTKAENCHVTAIYAAGIGVGRSSESTINDTTARHCTVSTSRFGSGAGIGAGISSVSKITGTNALNCTVSTAIAESDAGIGAGRSITSNVTDTNAVNCTVSTSSPWSDAGIGAGESVDNSTVINTSATGCNVTVSDSSVLGNVEAHAGIGAGISVKSKVKNTIAHGCIVKTINSKKANAGIGVGVNDNGAVTNTKAIGCTLKTSGDEAKAGIGAGINNIYGMVEGTTAERCHVTTSGDKADAGIGAGENRGTVIDTAALATSVTTGGNDADAGIGSGTAQLAETVTSSTIVDRNTIITGTIAIQSNVTTGGNNANAGIGAGYCRTDGVIANTKALKCQMKTSRFYSNAGIGAGKIGHRAKVNITNTKVFDSSIRTRNPDAAINAGHKPVVCQVLVDGRKKDCSPECFDVSDINFCADLNQPGARSYCHDVFDNRVNCDNPPLTYPFTETVTPPIPTLNISSPNSDTTPPTNAPTLTVMPPSSSVSTQFATSPLTKSLSPAVVATIASLGTALIVLIGVVIGVLTYYRRASANAGRNQPVPEQPVRRLWAERPLPAPPRNVYQLLPVSQGNTSTLPTSTPGYYELLPISQGNRSALPASVQGHYQPLSDSREKARTLPATPHSHYQPLTGSQGSTATGGSNPLVGNPAPPPSDYPEQSVYENIDNYRIPLANGQARTATAGSTTPMASTGHEPTPGQQYPGSPCAPGNGRT